MINVELLCSFNPNIFFLEFLHKWENVHTNNPDSSMVGHLINCDVHLCAARPGSTKAAEKSSRVHTEPVYMLEDYTLGPQFNLDDPDWHYVYVCKKVKQSFSTVPNKVLHMSITIAIAEIVSNALKLKEPIGTIKQSDQKNLR